MDNTGVLILALSLITLLFVMGYIQNEQIIKIEERQHKILDTFATVITNGNYNECIKGHEDHPKSLELCEQVRYLTIKEIYKMVNE